MSDVTAKRRTTYVVTSHYFVRGEGWKIVELELDRGASYEAAGREASRVARELDAVYGGDHFWTVDLYGEHGSYYQLFHGRLS